jgi:CIC family chloride channel protein
VAVCSPLVGLIAGLGAAGFLAGLEALNALVLGGLLGFHPPPTAEGPMHAVTWPAPPWLIVLLPTVGGLLAGIVVFTWAPETEGHGTDSLIRAFHRGAGQIRTRVPAIKAIASLLTIGSGGSAGVEGPIGQIGAGFGSWLARLLRLSVDERRLLVLAGAAGGIGAIFRAPLGGALFIVEVLYSSTAIEAAALLPCASASIVAYCVFALFITPRPLFVVPPLAFHGLADLPAFVVLALVCAGMGWLWVRVFYGSRDRIFHHIPLPHAIRPALGGLMMGLLAVAFPQVMGGGYGWVQWGAIGMPPWLTMPDNTAWRPEMGAGLLLLLAVLKIVATSLTVSSGGSGGAFGPSIVIGGLVGGAVGQAMAAVWPGPTISPAAFTLVGMGGFFAGVSKTPLAAIVMVCEMSGSYSLLVPLMLVCLVNLGLSRRWTLFEEQVGGPIDSPAHQGDFVIDVLERVRVGDVAIRSTGLEPIAASLPFPKIVERVAASTESLFPVVDPEGRLTGIFTLRDIRVALLNPHFGSLVVAADFAHAPVRTVTPDDDLYTALKRLTELNIDEIPVVGVDDPTRLVGLLDRQVLVAAYTREVERLRGGSEEPRTK